MTAARARIANPPAALRKAEVAALMAAFAKAFDVEALPVARLTADDALEVFREFTAVCMEAALASPAAAQAYRARLGECATDLGQRVRRTVPLRGAAAFGLVRWLYRGIGIELAGEVPGTLRFGPCFFARRYTSDDCWFMSAFDEGFIRGVTGARGTLLFTCRLTEGAHCCCAHLG